MGETIILLIMLLGSFLLVIAGIGILRLPDFYLRMSATSKAATLGSGLLIVAVAFYFNEFSVSMRALALIVFLFITSPVAAHMLARSAYIGKVPLWRGTIQDDLKGHYSKSTHALEDEIISASDQIETAPEDE